MVRADHGTENCLVAKCHIAFRMDHEDCLSGARSFIYGPSTANIVSSIHGFMVVYIFVHCQEDRGMVVTVAKV